MWNEQACLHTELSLFKHNANIHTVCTQTEKEKRADTSKHNAFEGAPVQIRSSTVKHKD